MAGVLAAGLSLVVLGTALAGGPTPPKVPAAIRVTVDPETSPAGEKVAVLLALEPIEGVKINRYPQIKLEVEARAGLVGRARAVAGDDVPPPVEKMQSNYFDKIEPLRLALDVDAAAPAGRHELEAKLTYFYCMPASGFCAPVRVPVTIPLEVR